MFKKKTHKYVSPIDLALAEFDKTHAPSPAQLAEIKKHQRIYKLRDKPKDKQ